jgi:putative chitinase
MAIRLTLPLLREIFPRGHAAALQSFIDEQAMLDRHGVSHTRTRLAHMLTHLYVESMGLTVFRENLYYSAPQLLRTFPHYFNSLEHAQQYAMQPQKIANYVYGNRMSNGPAGSGDGWRYAGKSGTQITGLDGYIAITRFSGHDFVNNPDDAADPKYCCMIAVAFWAWKNVARGADTGDITKSCLIWNGGYNGLTHRRAEYPRILKILDRAEGAPASATPPAEALDAASANERMLRNAGIATTGATAATKTATSVQQPEKIIAKPESAWDWTAAAGLALGIVIVVAGLIAVAIKKKAVIDNWK